MESKIKPPIFNRVPFLKTKVPKNIQDKLKEEYKNYKFSVAKEQPGDGIKYDKNLKTFAISGISIKNSSKPYAYECKISNDLYELCYHELTPIVEEWSKVELDRSWGYGVRSYVKNSILHLHRDRCDTHVISCIIYVDQKSERNWPLDFYDHDNNHHQVFFEDGDMLLYESLCVHGRSTPFQGEYYRNMYFHWKPKNWNNDHLYDLKTTFTGIEEYYNFYGK